MGRSWLVCCLFGTIMLGCGSGSPPKGKRGGPEVVEKKGRIDGGEEEERHEKYDDSGGAVRLESLTLTAPKGWPRKAPRSTFIQAEYVLPRADGDSQDGRLTLSVAGGSIEDNIARWKDQFGGAPEKAREEKIDVKGVGVMTVDLSGVYNDQAGPFAPAVKRPGYRMIAAIVPLGDQLHFVKAVGPARTMEAQADKINAFIRSVTK
ncbi:MAG: hypothetical protein U0793_30140 [Gemmataceae bacterium]